jgi:hypothetical protein
MPTEKPVDEYLPAFFWSGHCPGFLACFAPWVANGPDGGNAALVLPWHQGKCPLTGMGRWYLANMN